MNEAVVDIQNEGVSASVSICPFISVIRNHTVIVIKEPWSTIVDIFCFVLAVEHQIQSLRSGVFFVLAYSFIDRKSVGFYFSTSSVFLFLFAHHPTSSSYSNVKL